MEELKPIVTLTDVLEYLYCPRFIFYMHCLGIPQHEATRLKVQLGREVHEQKKRTNIPYLRKRIGVIKKEIHVYLASPTYQIKGILDEVLFLKDNTAAPLEYKFAEYKEKTFETYKYQLVIQGLLIEEQYNIPVKKGFICYTRSNHLLKEHLITENNRRKAKTIIKNILSIMENGCYPQRTTYKKRCVDCCYRNICIR